MEASDLLKLRDKRTRNRRCKEAKHLQQHNRHQDALVLLRDNLDLATRELGLDHLDTINHQESLSDCLSEIGDYAAAAALDRKTLRARRKVDPEHRSTLATQYSLAYNLARLEKFDEAIDLFRKNLTTRKKVLGNIDDDTLETRQHLAKSLHDTGEYEEARDLNEQVLQARENQSSPEGYELIACRHNLATDYQALGDFDKALTLTGQNLDALRQAKPWDETQFRTVLSFSKDVEKLKEFADDLMFEAMEKKHIEMEKKHIEKEKEYLEKKEIEKERIEKERIEKERIEEERIEKEIIEKEIIEKERTKRKRVERERIEKERAEKKRIEAREQKRAAEGREAERLRAIAQTAADEKAKQEKRQRKKEENLREQQKLETENHRGASNGDLLVQEDVKKVGNGQGGNSPLQSRSGRASEHMRPISDSATDSKGNETDGVKSSRITLSPLSKDRKPRTRSNENVDRNTGQDIGVNTLADRISRPKSANFIPVSLYSDLCDALDGGNNNEADVRANLSWFKEFDSKTQRLLAQGRKSSGRRVKIAILDTGIDLAHPDFSKVDPNHEDYGTPRDRVKWKSFVSSDGDQDHSGHGTHSVALLLRLAPKAKIFVARVVEGRTGVVEPATVAKAIKYAALDWEVDIITMSFGWPRWHDCVEEEIKTASSRNVILFAAASNSGLNKPVAFPANCAPVICVHSANGFGVPSHFTPVPVDGDHNFAVLGEAVRSSWPVSRGEGHEKRQWGSSTSTPILAAIAALVLEFVNQKPSLTANELRLRSPKGITRVLLAMSMNRYGYNIVMPWKILDACDGRDESQSRISNTLKFFGPDTSAIEVSEKTHLKS